MIVTADAIREALIAEGFDRPAYDELVTHDPSALTDRERGAVLAWALLGEVDRLTTQAALDAAALTTPEVYVGVVSAAVEEEIGRLRRQRDEALADLAALRLEHEAHKILLTCARRDRDEARDETTRLWDATEADRARMAALESRPTYEDGVREAAEAVDNCDNLISVPRTLVVAGGVYAHSDTVRNNILALLEPKT